MGQDPDDERIRRKAHELWEAEGHPHGRDHDHWDQAREIIALEDSYAGTLLPRGAGVAEPVESSVIAANQGDVPGMTDQGEHDLTATSREPVPERTSTPLPLAPQGAAPAAPETAPIGKKPAVKNAAKLATSRESAVKRERPHTSKKKK